MTFEQKRNEFIEAYIECQDLTTAARKVGMNMLIAFKILKISGVMLVNDRLKYGSGGSKMGAMAELEFQKLVPIAKQMNSNSKQNPQFDFLVGNKKIDVKAASLTKYRGNENRLVWHFHVRRHYQTEYGADFYVFFCALNGQKISSGYDLYLVPTELMGGEEHGVRTIMMRESEKHSHWLSEFKIDNDEILDFFTSIDDKNIEHARGYFKIEDKAIEIPEKNIVTFAAGKGLKEALN